MTVPDVVRADLDLIVHGERDAKSEAYVRLMQATDGPVSWAYEVWGDLVVMLGHKDNHTRTIAAQLLCNLAASDPEKRMARDIDKVMDVTHDDKFVTARHTILALWKIGLNPTLRPLLLDRVSRRYDIAAAEKNTTLVRYDLLIGLKRLYDDTRDEAVRALALELIPREPDAKYVKKYRTVWRA